MTGPSPAGQAGDAAAAAGAGVAPAGGPAAGQAGTTGGRPAVRGTKALPEPTPETQPFWDGCAAGELRLQRCADCGPYFYPRPTCPGCGSSTVEWFTASGRATLYSYTITHRAAPGFQPPYAIAVVELAEGPRMMTNIVGVDNTPESLVLDMDLAVTFERRGDVWLPQFTPVEAL